MSIHEVLEYLPHRFPFLLVDRVRELELGKRIVAIKNVTINEPFFQGHFPKEPIMPGVLIVEAMAQVSGILGFSLVPDCKVDSVVFMGMDRVKFRKPVRPGDQLIIKARLLKQKGRIFKVHAEAFVDDHLVAEAELMAALNTFKGDPEV